MDQSQRETTKKMMSARRCRRSIAVVALLVSSPCLLCVDAMSMSSSRKPMPRSRSAYRMAGFDSGMSMVFDGNSGTLKKAKKPSRKQNRVDTTYSISDSSLDVKVCDRHTLKRSILAKKVHNAIKTGASGTTTQSKRGQYGDRTDDYISQICNHDLLTREEEILLGREIQMLVKMEKRRDELEQDLLRYPTYEEWGAYLRPKMTTQQLKSQIRRSLRAKTALTQSNVRLVVFIAKRYRRDGVSFQDMCQEGIVALARASEKFDPEMGCRFSTYAVWWIRQAVANAVHQANSPVPVPSSTMMQLRALRKTQKSLQFELDRDPTIDELARSLGFTVDTVKGLMRTSKASVSIDEEVGGNGGKGSGASTGGKMRGSGRGPTRGEIIKDSSKGPADKVGTEMLQSAVSQMLCTLSFREQNILKMRFGLDGFSPKTLEEIGSVYSITRERVRQIEAKAFHKLRQPYRCYEVLEYI